LNKKFILQPETSTVWFNLQALLTFFLFNLITRKFFNSNAFHRLTFLSTFCPKSLLLADWEPSFVHFSSDRASTSLSHNSGWELHRTAAWSFFLDWEIPRTFQHLM
jgi:hypothetical protein